MATTPSRAIAEETTGNALPLPPALKPSQLEALLASTPAAIAFLTGPEMRCSYVNEMAVRVTGRKSAAQLLGCTFQEALPELAGTGVFEIIEAVVRSGQPFSGPEFRVPFRQFETGEIEERYFDFVCQPIVGVTGALDGIFIHAVDLTDRVLSRRALEKTEARLRLAHEAAQIGTWEWDPVEDVHTLSSEMHRMLGTDPGWENARIFEVFASRVHRQDITRVKQLRAEAQHSGSLDVEYRYLHPDRGLRMLVTKGRRIPGTSALSGVVLDITDQKTAEKQLLEQRERFEYAADAADIGYWFCDLPFDKLVWDERVKKHFWLKPDAAVDIELFYQRLHPDDREPTRRALQDAIDNQTTYDVEYRTISPDGNTKWIRATGRTAYDGSGKPIRFDGVTQDVTALKQTREALIRSEKLALVGRLAASISHEINNPLEAVINLLYLINENCSDEMVKLFSQSAQQELARVSHIVTHTLRFNRQNQKAAHEKVSELLDLSAAIYQPRIKNLGVEIQRDYRDSASVLCFGSELRQVFANLIGNSFDALKPGGRLVLRSRDQVHPRTGERGVRVTVADNGTGMDEAIRSRLFEPFFTTKGEKGTGLGLWVSREILRKHRSSVRIRSRKAPQKGGTTFSIWLPAEACSERE